MQRRTWTLGRRPALDSVNCGRTCRTIAAADVSERHRRVTISTEMRREKVARSLRPRSGPSLIGKKGEPIYVLPISSTPRGEAREKSCARNLRRSRK